MPHDKLIQIGHVHGKPDRIVSDSYSWPKGANLEELEEITAGFVNAFTPIRFEAILDNIPAVWYFTKD